MKPGQPFIRDGKRYYYVRAAARIAGVSHATLWRWAAENVTNFGFELGVVRAPPAKSKNYNSWRKRRDFRMLIPEEKLLILKRVLHDFPMTPKGPISDYERETLSLAARLYSGPADAPAPHP